MFDRLIIPQVPNTVHFDYIKTLDFARLAQNTNVLDENFSCALKEYYDKYTKKNGKPFYNLSLSYNSIMNDKRFRFLLIDVNDSRVFIPYKVIQILKTKQIRFFGFPISNNSNKESETLVYDELRKLEFCRFVLSNDSHIVRGYKRLVEYDDYYYALKDKRVLYQSSKYRSKNYINKIMRNNDVCITFGVNPNETVFLELRDKWKIGMASNGSFVSSTNDKHFASMLTSRHIDLRFLCIYYKGELLSLQVFLCNSKFQYADCLYIHHLWKAQGDNDVKKRILGNIVEIQKFLSFEYLYKKSGIDRIYLAGCRPSEHRLLAHKERISDDKIEYFIL